MRQFPLLPSVLSGDTPLLDTLFDFDLPPDESPAPGKLLRAILEDLVPPDPGGQDSDQFVFDLDGQTVSVLGESGPPDGVPSTIGGPLNPIDPPPDLGFERPPESPPPTTGLPLKPIDPPPDLGFSRPPVDAPVGDPPAEMEDFLLLAKAGGFAGGLASRMRGGLTISDEAGLATLRADPTDGAVSAKGGAPGRPDPGTTDGGTGTDGSTADAPLSSYISGALTGSGFNIEIKFSGTWTVELQQSFIDSAELLSEIIRDDIPDVRFRGKIDDITIDAQLVAIDGEGGILGQAGVSVYRTASDLPAYGFMQFDSADAAYFDSLDLFNDIVFHEMMHVLGFGTMWDEMGLVRSVTGGLEFFGAQAVSEFITEFGQAGATGVAVESEGSAGTAGGHWNEKGEDGFGFGNEIMTGYIDPQNYLSDTTIAALDDMGYGTVYAANADVVGGLSLADTIFNDQLIA